MDASQFKQCFLPCHEQLFRMAWRLTGNMQAAEDLVQETFLKLWVKRDELATVDSYEGFSVTILKHLFYDELRKHRLQTTPQALEQLQIPHPDDTAGVFEEEDSERFIINLIRQLPKKQQQVMLLRDVEGLDYQEIEKLTGQKVVHIRVLLSRARKQIRQQLKEMMQNGK